MCAGAGRRLRVRAVRRATRRTDRVLYPVLAAVLLAGLCATLVGPTSAHYDYRLGVSVWFRTLFELSPDVPAMAHAPLIFQLHTLPLAYLARPYILYRSRGGAITR
ncbi:respiratory nitrate reductase subunit gamma [Nonomuraea angiospora]|uniref:respiratory nitrate reductase subunit gamma n=1 Tax=Nonomuraea angiospora TaxID=46172 RepID=UPI003421378A